MWLHSHSTAKNPESLSESHLLTLHKYTVYDVTDYSVPAVCFIWKGWGLNTPACSDYENIHCVAEICHVATKTLFALETDHRQNSPYRESGCSCTWYLEGLTILGKPPALERRSPCWAEHIAPSSVHHYTLHAAAWVGLVQFCAVGSWYLWFCCGA